MGLSPKMCASLEEVSRTCFHSSAESAVWSATGCMAQRVLDASGFFRLSFSFHPSCNDLRPCSALYDLVARDICVRAGGRWPAESLAERNYRDAANASLLDILRLLRTTNTPVARAICNFAQKLDDGVLVATEAAVEAENEVVGALVETAHRTFVGTLGSVLEVAGCKGLLKYLVKVRSPSSLQFQRIPKTICQLNVSDIDVIELLLDVEVLLLAEAILRACDVGTATRSWWQ